MLITDSTIENVVHADLSFSIIRTALANDIYGRVKFWLIILSSALY